MAVVRVYVVEEQEIYREVYKSIFPLTAPLELIGVSTRGNTTTLSREVLKLRPDVVLLSIKKLQKNAVDELEQMWLDCPGIGIVLLLVFCSAQDAELLRQLALKGKGGMALCLKQSLDQVEQLYRTILAASQGQVVLDPALATIMFAGKPECQFLQQLTARELEILGLLSKGYTNLAIAEMLYIEVKTVEHHLNSMYSKLKTDPDFNDKHLRVSAAKLYLETVGGLYREDSLASVGAHRGNY